LFKGDRRKRDWECFNEFIRYMGAGAALNKRVAFEGKTLFLKDAVRNGLAHRYFMKAREGAMAMISSAPEALRTGFIIEPPNRLVMVVVPFFNLFAAALDRALQEGRMS
jgi:hypothetical protein